MIGFLVLSGCKEEDSTFSITLDQLTDTTFLFALASSAESCGVLLSNGVNCAQSITFSSANVATVIVTDIVNAGTYSVDGNIITVTLPNSDSENPMIFNANTEVTELIGISDGSNDIWKLAIEGIDPWDL